MKNLKPTKQFLRALLLIFLSTFLFFQNNAAQFILPVGVQPAVFIPSNPTSDNFVQARLETRFCSEFANTLLDFPSTPVNGIITIQSLGALSFDFAFSFKGV